MPVAVAGKTGSTWGKVNLTNRQLKARLARKPKVKTPTAAAGPGCRRAWLPPALPALPQPAGAAGGGGPLGARRLLAASPLRGPRFLSGGANGSGPWLREGLGGGPGQTLLPVTRAVAPLPAAGSCLRGKAPQSCGAAPGGGTPRKLLRAHEDGPNAPAVRWEVRALTGAERGCDGEGENPCRGEVGCPSACGAGREPRSAGGGCKSAWWTERWSEVRAGQAVQNKSRI